MTLLQIYNTICSIVFGDPEASPPPDHEVARMQDDILYNHHAVQRDYNYWFMYMNTTLPLISGTDTYALPAMYKELVILDTDNSWEMLGNNLFFKDGISKDEEPRFDYWKFIETPVWADTYTDAVTTSLHYVIIYTVVANLFQKRSEMTQYQSYLQRAEEAKFLAQNEDFSKRQHHLTAW